MARGNFRANKSWGCTYCGEHSRDESYMLYIRGKGSNKLYLCPEHAKIYDETNSKKNRSDNFDN